MIAKKSIIQVTTDLVHGWKCRIVEYWIPEDNSGISFNFEHGMNVFKSDKPRSQDDLCKTEVPDEDVEIPDWVPFILSSYLVSKKTLETFEDMIIKHCPILVEGTKMPYDVRHPMRTVSASSGDGQAVIIHNDIKDKNG